jgi:hypothetical protein
MTAATLLAEHTQALDAVLLRLRVLEQETQTLFQQRLRLEGAVQALQALVDASSTPEVCVCSQDGTTPLVAR